MAPELRNGEKPSVGSDIYALGCICYEMLAGTRLREPGVPGQPSSTYKPARVHPRWSGILARCLDPDPARRYRSVEEIEQALAPRSRRLILAVAAGVGLASVVGVGAWNVATAPKKTLMLAVAPFEGAPDAKLARDVIAQLGRIRGNAQTLLSPGKPKERHTCCTV